MRSRLLRRAAAAAAWAILLLLAFRVDRWVYLEVAGWVAERTGEETWRFGRPGGGRATSLLELLHLLKRMGHVFFTILVSVTILLLAPGRRRQVAALWLAIGLAAAAGQGLLKPGVAKVRPDAPLSREEAARLVAERGEDAVIEVRGHTLNRGSPLFRPAFSGYRDLRGLTFPSGHSALAFASCVVLAAAFPRGRWWFLSLAAGVAASRVLMGEHFLSDVVAGSAVGYVAGRALLSIPRVRAWMAAP